MLSLRKQTRDIMKNTHSEHDFYPWLNIKAEHKKSLSTKLKSELILNLQIVSSLTSKM